MRIAKFEIFQYAIPLRKPVVFKKSRLAKRQGLILRLTSERNVVGYGEVSPLPGFSRETLSSCKAQLLKVKAALDNFVIPPEIEEFPLTINKTLKKLSLLPSVTFGVEMALCNLLAGAKKALPCKVLNFSYPKTILNCGLLNGDLATISAEAKEFIKRGYKVLKLKVGSADIISDIQKVTAVRAIAGNRAKLRLDCNQAWSLREAIKFARAIGIERIEYIEEPLRDPKQLNSFFYDTYLPVALDESLGRLSFDALKKFDGLKAFIIKPTLIGGIEKSLALMQTARKLKLDCVISSSFETGIGLSFLANMHAAYATGTMAAGLDTLKYFQTNLLTKSSHFHQARFNLDSLTKSQNLVSQKLLKKIS